MIQCPLGDFPPLHAAEAILMPNIDNSCSSVAPVYILPEMENQGSDNTILTSGELPATVHQG